MKIGQKITAGHAAGKNTVSCRMTPVKWIALAGLILLFLLVFCVFSTKPVPFLSEIPSEQEQILLESVIEKFADSLLDSSGNVAEEASLTLTAEETDALVKGCLRSLRNTHDIPRGIQFQGSWEQGGLLLKGSAFRQPFLPGVRGSVLLDPGWKNGTLSCKVLSCRLGMLRLPSSVPESVIDDLLISFRNSPEYEEMEQIFISAETLPSGSVHVVFRPVNISRFTRFLMLGMP